jgi:NAD(P)-dependent dehydrogenase (short-subunit alcohol dehydrogenase family)
MSGALEQRHVLVTGGTRGIGAAIARRLVADGGTVTVTGTRPDGTPPEGCAYAAVDFGDRAATAEFARRLAGEQVDVLINNAGINRLAPFADVAMEDFDALFDVNVRAPMMLCQAVVPGMRARGWGRIVNLSSIWGVISRAHRASYSTTKFGIDGMTAALAAEVSADGVMANCVSPGFTDTELTRNTLGPAGMAEIADRIPARRLAVPEEIAELVAWLAGPLNTYTTGQNVVIDGGFTRT